LKYLKKLIFIQQVLGAPQVSPGTPLTTPLVTGIVRILSCVFHWFYCVAFCNV